MRPSSFSSSTATSARTPTRSTSLKVSISEYPCTKKIASRDQRSAPTMHCSTPCPPHPMAMPRYPAGFPSHPAAAGPPRASYAHRDLLSSNIPPQVVAGTRAKRAATANPIAFKASRATRPRASVSGSRGGCCASCCPNSPTPVPRRRSEPTRSPQLRPRQSFRWCHWCSLLPLLAGVAPHSRRNIISLRSPIAGIPLSPSSPKFESNARFYISPFWWYSFRNGDSAPFCIRGLLLRVHLHGARTPGS